MVERLFDQFDQLWTRVGNILQDRRPVTLRQPAPYDLEMQGQPSTEERGDTVLDFYDDDDNDHNDNNEDRDEAQEEEPIEEPIMSDYDFIKDYSAFLYAYYGRAPRYMTDLFCCMSPIMVEMMSGDHSSTPTLHRWWWLPVNHPLVVRMQAFHEINCGQVSAGVCGSFVIYGDKIIVKWIRELGRLFSTQLGQDLEVTQKPEPAPETSNPKEEEEVVAPPPLPPMTRLQMPPSPQLPLVPPIQEKAPDERPPVIRMSIQSVSNKKGD